MKNETLLKRLLARQCRKTLRQHAIVSGKGTEAGIHDLRVATRRLQELLEFLEPVLPSRARRRLSRRARRIRRSLGTIRNLDVMRDLVKRLERDRGPELRWRLQALRARLASESRELRRAAGGRSGLKLPELRPRVERLDGQVRPVDGFSIPKRAREILGSRATAMTEAITAARTGRSAPIHALRVVIKRHRYALEILDQSGLRDIRPAIAGARMLQTRLGKLHDLDVLASLVRQHAAPSSTRMLLGILREERRKCLAEAIKAIDRFDAQRALSIVDAAVARVEAA